jgi:demethylmenaquinone methyltransferase/2-methoxy-6-polyprenyl-1,4-benzoquinol methylase
VNVSSKVQSPASEATIAEMFNRIANRYDFLNALLSARQDRRWRKALLRCIPYRPEGTLLDVATGTGDVLLQAARAHTEYSDFIGVDIADNMLALARNKQEQHPHKQRMRFANMSAERLDLLEDSVDCLTISFGLRNVVNRDAALREFSRVLRNSGSLLILEFFTPPGTMWSRFFQFYFHNILPLIGGLFSDRSAYTYLPQSVGSFYSISELGDKLREVGYRDIRMTKFLFGSCYLVQARKP